MGFKVGVIGLGLMGIGIARNIIDAGHSVRGFDLSDEALTALSRAGGAPASSPADAATNVEFVMTVLPEPRDVETAILNSQDAVINGLSQGGMVIDFSTIDPDTTRRVGSALAERKMRMIECKMGGSSTHAAAGDLTLMTGGSEADLSEAAPLLEAVSTEIIPCGQLGNGSAMKLVNNMLASSILMVNAEALVTGRKNGLDIDVMLRVFRSTFANNESLSTVFEQKVFNRDFKAGFFTRLALKDVRLATQMASESGAITPMGAIAQQMLAAATYRGYATDHVTSVIKLWEEVAGIELTN